MGYDFLVEYRSGKLNTVADALSRKEEEVELKAISFPVASWLEVLKEEHQNDKAIQEKLQQLKQGLLDLTRFTEHNGLLFYKGRFYLDSNSSLKDKILQELHNSPIGGHSVGCAVRVAVMAWKQILSNRSTLSTLHAVPGFTRFFSKSSPYIDVVAVKVGIPEFLNGVGRGIETHVTKLETEIGDFQKLLVTRTLKLKKLGIPCKHRKLILKYSHKYRLGLWRPRAEPVKSQSA
ncbi:hypothetical protein HHK36_027220 [Tetracentron sinense]|uniref:Small ribosomal subunit protein mS41 SAM domain-containing protein n=1 Tax=Tetracentron sinense TaxID=13715 RepID=A0A834YL03_TETSI|nr:hypothetical protein HHK36_027220 [Tetracentron sinense]